MDDREYLETIVDHLKTACDWSSMDGDQKRVYKVAVDDVLRLYTSGIMRDEGETAEIDSVD